eukprot:COSAG02_NODE_384_length_23406_cov_9.459733_16_plen_98_part_00
MSWSLDHSVAWSARPQLPQSVRHGEQGSGLLAMLAAKAGAKQVYTIEANPDYARLATEIVELNHLDKQVTVLNTLSTKVEVKEGAQDSSLLVSYHHK